MEPFDDFEWRGLLWPEIDPLDLPGRQLGKEIKLKNYRWPPANNQRKGVVFIFHGYGSMASHMAILAKYLAQANYEVFAMDMSGHGDSTGERGVIDSAEQLYNDYW